MLRISSSGSLSNYNPVYISFCWLFWYHLVFKFNNCKFNAEFVRLLNHHLRSATSKCLKYFQPIQYTLCYIQSFSAIKNRNKYFVNAYEQHRYQIMRRKTISIKVNCIYKNVTKINPLMASENHLWIWKYFLVVPCYRKNITEFL